MTEEDKTKMKAESEKTRAWVKRTPEEIEELKKKIEEQRIKERTPE